MMSFVELPRDFSLPMGGWSRRWPRLISLELQDAKPEHFITMAELSALYDIGRSLGYPGMESRYDWVRKEFKDAGSAVYESITFHKGEWTDDRVEYDNAVVLENGIRAYWVERPNSMCGWRDGERHVHAVELPKEGVIVPIKMGWNDARTGAPFMTIPFSLSEKARELLEREGYDLQRDPPCHFYPGEPGMVAAVRRGRGTNAGGKFNILAFEPVGAQVENVGYRAVEY